MKNTNKKNVNRSNGKKKTEVTPYNYRPVQYGKRKFETTSQLIRYMLTHNKSAKRSQSDIARLCGVSQPCVCQLAAELR